MSTLNRSNTVRTQKNVDDAGCPGLPVRAVSASSRLRCSLPTCTQCTHPTRSVLFDDRFCCSDSLIRTLPPPKKHIMTKKPSHTRVRGTGVRPSVLTPHRSLHTGSPLPAFRPVYTHHRDSEQGETPIPGKRALHATDPSFPPYHHHPPGYTYIREGQSVLAPSPAHQSIVHTGKRVQAHTRQTERLIDSNHPLQRGSHRGGACIRGDRRRSDDTRLGAALTRHRHRHRAPRR